MVLLPVGKNSRRGFLFTLAALAVAGPAATRAGEIPIPHLVTAVDPVQHDIDGGSRIYVFGDGSSGGFQAGDQVLLNDAAVADLIVLSPRSMTGTVPDNPAGTYDLVLKDQFGTVRYILTDAVEYMIQPLPPPEDVSLIRVDDVRVRLKWSNPTLNDLLHVKRNGSTVATLAGDATEYTDTLPSPPTSAVLYEVIAEAGIRSSSPATIEYLPWRDECLPILGTGGSGRASGLWFALITGVVDELQMCFHLEEDAPAVLFQVFMAKVRLPGQLKCRIRSFDPPHDVLGPAYDGIGVEDFALFREDYTEAVLPVPLAAGDYIIGFYSDGVDPNQWSYEIQLDGDPENPGDPCPPPFYPMLRITPLCDNLPPTVLDITVERPHLDANFDLDRLPFGMLPLAELDLTLRADAVDYDGAVVRYGWTISFACDHLAGEEEADCLRRCAEERACLDAFNSDADSGLYHFPFIGNWTVGVTVTDNAGATAFASETIYVDVFDEPPPCGEAPKIYHRLDPDVEDPFYNVRYIPDINSNGPVHQEFTVKVTPSNCTGIESVEMLMIDPVNGVTYPPLDPAAVIPESVDPATGAARSKASFNMSDLGYRDRFLLQVTATDDDGLQTVQDWTIPMCVLPLLFDSDHNEVDFVGTSIEYDSGSNRYDVGARLPEEPILDLPIDLDDLGIHLENVVDAYLKFEEYLDDEFWHPQSVKGKMRATLLSYDLFDKDWETSLDGPVAYGCDDYEIQYHASNIDIYSDDWSWEVFDTTLWEGFVGPVHVRVRGSLDVGLGIDLEVREVHLIVRTVEEAGDPVVEIGVEVVPAVEAWAEGEIRVEVFFGLASASVLLRPTLGIEFPIELQGALPPIALNVTVDECFRLKLEIKVRACADLPFVGEECVSSAWLEIFNEEFGGDCGAAREALRGAGQEEPSDLKYPSIAVSPDGQTAIAVLVDDSDPDPGVYTPELYYALDSGLGFEPPAPIYPAGDVYTQRDSNVVFLTNTQALAVWTQGRLTRDEVAALPQTTDGANTGFKNQDIFYALWNEVGGWGLPQMLTNDATPNPRIPEGKPTVAAIPGDDAAWVVWVRSDNESFFDVNGDPNLRGLSIFARKIDGGAPGAMHKITLDDGADPAADIQPTVAVSPSGAVTLAVWVRDQDGDFDTSDDRRLMYSLNFGGAWTAPLSMTDPAELPGVLMPSVALRSDDDGMVAFTVRERSTSGQIAGEGNKDLVYTIEIENTAFQTPVPLRRPAEKRGPRVFDRVYGRDPLVRYLDSVHAAVVFRSFDGFGRTGGDGEVGISVIDLSQPSPQWSYARDLTDDAYRDWDIAAGVGPSCIRTVRDSANPLSPPDFHGLVFDDIVPAPDVVVDRIRLSNPHAPAGSVVTATVVVRNGGLMAPVSTTPTVLRLGEVVNDEFQEMSAIPFLFTAAPDQIQVFSDSFFMPEKLTHLRAVVDPIAAEADTENNAAEVMLGVLPPGNVTCVNLVRGTRPRVGLHWTNAEPYESILVYREGRFLAELDGDLESFIDSGPSPGLHTWSLRGKIGLALSDPAEAQCTLAVTLPGDSDLDQDVDLLDAAQLVDLCLGGPDVPYGSGCAVFDFDGDGDVDLKDFGTLTLAFTGDL